MKFNFEFSLLESTFTIIIVSTYIDIPLEAYFFYQEFHEKTNGKKYHQFAEYFLFAPYVF